MSELTLLTLPIGNPQDITLRALEALKTESFFLAEDTREFVKLMRVYGIDTKSKEIDSFHDHSSDKIAPLIQKILDGRPLVLVSDAGSPIISDPAYPLVKAALEKGIKLRTFPGVTSLVTALELSGLPPHPLHFFGFLSRDDSGKKQSFEFCSRLPGTHVFFESPHRMEKTLALLAEQFPETQVATARELTKTFETVNRFRAKDWKNEDIRAQGEFVLLLNFAEEEAQEDSEKLRLKEMALELIEHGLNQKKLSKLLADLTGLPGKDVYNKLTLKKDPKA